MTTNLTSQGDLIAELHLESLFNSASTHAEPEVCSPREWDAVWLRHRLALINKLAIDAQGLHAATNVADWRTYLPEDCVAAMIKDGWHRST
jgi:hypothetical protein